MYFLNSSKIIKADLDSSYEYIKKRLEAPRAANNLIEEAMRIMDYICETPLYEIIGARCLFSIVRHTFNKSKELCFIL